MLSSILQLLEYVFYHLGPLEFRYSKTLFARVFEGCANVIPGWAIYDHEAIMKSRNPSHCKCWVLGVERVDVGLR